MADQPETNLVSGLASNPPFSTKVNYNSSTTPIPLSSLFSSAGAAGISISAVAPNYNNAYMEDFNLNLQQQLSSGMAVSIGYYGSVGRHLRQVVNLNQPNALGVRPYPTISLNSPIDPGVSSNVNINQGANVGQSNYNAMWVTAQKNFKSGADFEVNYDLSKSLDLGSQTGTALQDATRPYLNYGPSDFDTRHRIAGRGAYSLPFTGNRLVEGWRILGTEQWQTGNPLNVVTTSTFTGTSGVLHPNLIGPVTYPKSKPSATAVQWFTNSICTQAATTPGCIFQIPTTGFGNMSRNKLIGPGFTDVDLSLEKNTRIYENLNFQLRADAFDIFNHPNFGNPVTTATPGSTSFGQITATRFLTGDAGSSRQIQIAAKLIF